MLDLLEAICYIFQKSDCTTMERVMEAPKWIDEKKVAEITGIALQTLRNWRCRGVGFPYSKVRPGGRMVRYRLNDIIAFMEQRRVEPHE